LVDAPGLIEVPLQLKRDGFAEQRGRCDRAAVPVPCRNSRRGLRFFQMQQPRFQVPGARPADRVALPPLLSKKSAASCQRPRRSRQTARFRFALACLGMHAEQLGVALRGLLVHLQFELIWALARRSRSCPRRSPVTRFESRRELRRACASM